MSLGQHQQPPHPPPAVPTVPAYTLIAVGPPRTGKSSLLRLLLDTSPISPHATPAQLESLARFLTPSTSFAFSECEVELLWAGERVLLRLIDTPPLNYRVEDDLERTLHDILTFIEDRYVDGARDRDDGESHVHLCLYVLDPGDMDPPSLNPSEISVIRKLSNRVNVLPILGRSDAITIEHLIKLKHSVRANLAEAGLGFGIFDEEAEAGIATTSDSSDKATQIPLLPFAIFSPEKYARPCTSSRHEIAAKFAERVVTLVDDVHGHGHSHTSKSPSHPISDTRSPLHDFKSPSQHSRRSTLSSKPSSPLPKSPTYDEDAYLPRGVYTRRFRWGVLDCLDRCHSDFSALRRAVMGWRNELKTYTKGYLYDRFKVESLVLAQRQPPHSHQLSPHSQRQLSPHQHHPSHPAYIHRSHLEREREREKERERKRVGSGDILHLSRDADMDRDRDIARERDMGREREKEVVAHLSPRNRETVHSHSYPHSYPQAHISPRDREMHVFPHDRDREIHISSRDRDIDRETHILPRDRDRDMVSPRDRERDCDRDMHISPHAHPREMHMPLHVSSVHAHPHSRDLERSHHTLPSPHTHTLPHAQAPPAPPALAMQHPLPHPPTLSPHQHHHEVHPQQLHSAVYQHDPRSHTRLPPIRVHHRYDEEEVVPGVGQMLGAGAGGQQVQGLGQGQGQSSAVGGQAQGPQQGGQQVMGLTANGRKRKITMACNFCRSRKLKCDGVRPACAQCVKRSNVCDYQPHAHTQAHSSSTSASTSAAVPNSSRAISSTTQTPPTPTSAAPPHSATHTTSSTTTSPSRLSTWRCNPKQRDSDIDELEDDGEDWAVGSSAGLNAGAVPAFGSGVDVRTGGARVDVKPILLEKNTPMAAAETGTETGGRRRVSVNMLIAETLGDREVRKGTGLEREREREQEGVRERGKDKPHNHSRARNNVEHHDPVPERDATATPASTARLTPAPAVAHSRSPDQSRSNSRNHDPGRERSRDPHSHAKSLIKSEDRERERWEIGMGVIDVGCEGDKKKRLNRQSANYGSKAVACVHCRARKTRCDAARPACGNCARRSLACSYIHTTPSQPRTKGKKEKTTASKEREREREKEKEGRDREGSDTSEMNTFNGMGAANTYAPTHNFNFREHTGAAVNHEKHDTLMGISMGMRNGTHEENDIKPNGASAAITKSVSKRDGSNTPSERSAWTSTRAGAEVGVATGASTNVEMDGGRAIAVEESAEREIPTSNPKVISHMSSSRSPPYQQQSHLHIRTSPPPIATLPVSASTDTTPAPTPTHTPWGTSRSGSEGAIDVRAHGDKPLQTRIQADQKIQTQQPLNDTRPHDRLPSPIEEQPSAPQDTLTRLSVDVSDVRSHPAPTSASAAHGSPHSRNGLLRQTETEAGHLQSQSRTLTPVPAPLTNGNGTPSSVNGAMPISDGVSTVNGKRKSPDMSEEVDSGERPDKKMKWMDMEDQQALKEVRVQ